MIFRSQRKHRTILITADTVNSENKAEAALKDFGAASAFSLQNHIINMKMRSNV